MIRTKVIIIVWIFCLLAPLASRASDSARATVVTEMHISNGGHFPGNGFFISSDILVTALHGLQPLVDKIVVRLPGTNFKPIQAKGILAYDEAWDLVAVKIEPPNAWWATIQPVVLEDDHLPEAGDGAPYLEAWLPEDDKASETSAYVQWLTPLPLKDLKGGLFGTVLRIQHTTTFGNSGASVMKPEWYTPTSFGMVVAFSPTWEITYVVPAERLIALRNAAVKRRANPMSIAEVSEKFRGVRAVTMLMNPLRESQTPEWNPLSYWKTEIWNEEENTLKVSFQPSYSSFLFAYNSYLSAADFVHARSLLAYLLNKTTPQSLDDYLAIDNIYVYYALAAWLTGDNETAESYYVKAIAQDPLDGGRLAQQITAFIDNFKPGKEEELRLATEALVKSQPGIAKLLLDEMIKRVKGK